MGFLFDVLLLALIGLFVWKGYRKGLILTVASVVVIFLAAFLAGRVASAFAEPVSQQIRPILSWVVEDAVNDAAQGRRQLNNISDINEISEIAENAFSGMGIPQRELGNMLERVRERVELGGQTVRESIELTALHAASYVLLAVFSFIIFMIGLTLLIHFISAIFRFPGLRLVDKIGGTAAGLVYGILIVSAAAWALRYLGIVMDSDMVNNTVVLRFFVNNNILSGILTFGSGIL